MSASKIGKNTTNILTCYFSKWIFTLGHQTKYLHIEKTKFTSHKQYLFGLPFSRNAKKTHTDQSFFFQCLCYWYNLLQCVFLFHVKTGSIFRQEYYWSGFFSTAMLLCSLKQVFGKKSVCFKFLISTIA